MDKSCIGMIAAMPEEIKPLLRRVGTHTREKLGKFNIYRFTFGTHDACLIESGMGTDKAAAATRALITAAEPALVINFGFAGAVTAGPVVGDIVVAERILRSRERLFSEQAGLATGKADELSGLLERELQGKGFHIRQGTFVTAARITNKREMAALLPAGVNTPVLEMETAAVALVTARGKTPLMALRAISDGGEEELGFAIEEFADREMNIRVWKVLLTVARKPRIVPQLLRLARNSRLAGENLALAVLAVLKSQGKG
jgi:adenosylhomocysteine nucleosidase